MGTKSQKIGLEEWPRRELFRFFSGMSNPFYSVTFRQDVTDLYRYTKKEGLSFYYALVYLATQAANEVEAFRCAITKDGPVLLNARRPSFTDLHPGAEAFHIVTMPLEGSLPEFCRAARAKSSAQTAFIERQDTDDLIYFSCLPWVELTALTNERDFDPDDSVPRISWGKYACEGSRRLLHISVEANHRFVDGLHIGRFHQALAAGIAAL